MTNTTNNTWLHMNLPMLDPSNDAAEAWCRPSGKYIEITDMGETLFMLDMYGIPLPVSSHLLASYSARVDNNWLIMECPRTITVHDAITQWEHMIIALFNESRD